MGGLNGWMDGRLEGCSHSWCDARVCVCVCVQVIAAWQAEEIHELMYHGPAKRVTKALILRDHDQISPIEQTPGIQTVDIQMPNVSNTLIHPPIHRHASIASFLFVCVFWCGVLCCVVQVTIPSNHTTYMCLPVVLPDDRKYHMVANDPLIDRRAGDLVHHMIIYHCDEPKKRMRHTDTHSPHTHRGREA